MTGFLVCPQCGQSFADFQKGGLLGCAGCYPAFATELIPVLKRLHGAIEHNSQLKPQHKISLADLEAQLQDAVAREAYEEASEIRDRILTLKQTRHDV